MTAIQKIEGFAATVQAHSGSEIPDVWRSARDLTNVAGAPARRGRDAALQHQFEEQRRRRAPVTS